MEKQTIYEKLQRLIPKEHIKQDEPLNQYTFTKTGGKADFLVLPSTYEEVQSCILFSRENSIPLTILGNGSNLIIRDGGIRGIVLILSHMERIEMKDGLIVAQSGATIINVSRFALEQSVTGLEFACGIPGSVGGAVYMNAGAYLSDISEVLEKVDILDENLEFRTLNKDELEFSYRSSIFMRKNYIILKAYLKVTKDDKDELIELLEDRKMRRVTSQPLEYPSAGSVFRNPEGMYAGKLIEDAGLRGFQKGGGEISSKHANFIINKDNATSQDIKDLMDLAHDKVKKEYNVDLHREQELFNWE